MSVIDDEHDPISRSPVFTHRLRDTRRRKMILPDIDLSSGYAVRHDHQPVPDESILEHAGRDTLTIRELHRLSVLSGAPVTERQLRLIINGAIKKLQKVLISH